MEEKTFTFYQKRSLSLIPVFFSIAIYVFVYSQIYVWISDSYITTDVFDISQALGALLLGSLSDRLCRRKTLLLSYLCGLILIYFVYQHPEYSYLLFALGLIYNPIPIVRAAMVDNMKSYSSIKLISISFVIQFMPEAFYYFYSGMDKHLAFYLCYTFLILGFLLSYFLFFDYRDSHLKKKRESPGSLSGLFHPNLKEKAFYTLIAFLPTQLVYFISDNLLSEYSNDPSYYSILSFGFVIGALISSLYKKTPHVSVITVTYGICLMLSLLAPAAIYVYQLKGFDLPFQFIIFGSLMGFYISFVYDTILRAILSDYRGTASGFLDFICASTYIINIGVLNLVKAYFFWALLFIVANFLLALYWQKRAE